LTLQPPITEYVLKYAENDFQLLVLKEVKMVVS